MQHRATLPGTTSTPTLLPRQDVQGSAEGPGSGSGHGPRPTAHGHGRPVRPGEPVGDLDVTDTAVEVTMGMAAEAVDDHLRFRSVHR
ncbi:hypothetical protein [Frankia sp. AvcI1]|uniref:hypothetical protein n=1 Tax=Frankia sp. AvcI1 TaxID=573496 RepID=UPI000A9266D4|nr:hypothetical protein [Frankia sp. AvcI1]